MPELQDNITNGILAEKINGLAKITDERLLTIKETLTRMELSASHYSTKSEVEEVKKDFNKIIENIKNEFIQHNKDDRESFGLLKDGYEKTQGTIKYAMGAIAVIMIVLQFVIPILLSYLKFNG